MRITCLVFLLGLLSVSSHGTGWAQGAPAAPAQPAPAAPAQVVTLGNSAVALTGPWRFSPGDSPWVNGSPVWAQPGFDDAHWATVDLTPKAGSVDLINGIAGFVPGWTARGYPELSGYAWYRLRPHRRTIYPR